MQNNQVRGSEAEASKFDEYSIVSKVGLVDGSEPKRNLEQGCCCKIRWRPSDKGDV